MTDVHQALGIGGGLGYAITNGAINRWNRFKPFRSSAQNYSTSGQTSGDRWNAMVAAKFGLNIQGYTGVSGLNDLVTAAKALGQGRADANCAWGYLRPRGQANYPSEWFRMLDLNGYKTGLNPTKEMTINPTYKYKIDTYQNAYDSTLSQDQNCNISLSDLGLSGYYVGIAYRPQSSSAVSGLSCKTVDSTTLVSLSLSLGTSYDAAWFFSPRALTGTGGIQSGDVFYSLPFPYVLIGSYNDWGLTLRGFSASYSSGRLNVTPKIQCLGGARTITKVRLCHRKSGNYGSNGDGTYWITATASSISSDNEADYSFLSGGNISVPETSGSSWNGFPYSGLESSVRLNINPYSGMTFVQLTTTHTYSGSVIEDRTYTFAFQYTLPQ